MGVPVCPFCGSRDVEVLGKKVKPSAVCHSCGQMFEAHEAYLREDEDGYAVCLICGRKFMYWDEACRHLEEDHGIQI